MPHVGPSSAVGSQPTAPRCLMLVPTLLQVPNLQPQDASCWPQLCCRFPTYSPKMPHVGPNSAVGSQPTAPRRLMLAPTLLKVPNLQPQDASCPKMPHVGPNSAVGSQPTAPRCLMLAPTLLKVPNLQPQDASCWPQLCCRFPTYSPKMPHVGPNSAVGSQPTAPRCLMLAPTLL